RENHSGPALGRHQLGECREKLGAVAGIPPRRAVPAEVKAARARGHPDFPRRAMAVHDDLRAVAELELQPPAFLELEIGVDAAFLKRALDPLQGLRRESFELPLIHGLTCGFYALPYLILCVSSSSGSPWRWCPGADIRARCIC